jgi:hypothetical protein
MPVPDFAVGEVLTSAAMDSIGLWLVKTQTVGTAVSTVTVTDAFSADYDNYKIVYNGGVSSASGELRMVLGSTNIGYFQNIIFTSWNNTVSAASTANGARFSFTGGLDPDGIYANFDLFNPFLAKRTMLGGPFLAPDSDRVGGFMSGYVANTTSYTDFTFSSSTGTMTGGTIRVYGYRN